MQSSRLTVLVTGVELWTPTIPNAAAWKQGFRDETATVATGTGLDLRTRRRASALARALAEVATSCTEQAKADRAQVPAIFGSSLGEATTMLKLLEQMWRTHEDMSPMHFAMSVHNAASGLWSIAGENRGFTTSLAADYDTPAMTLFEAHGVLDTFGGPVIVACGDDAAPDELVPVHQRFDLLAVGVALDSDTPQTRARVSPLATLRGPFLGEPSSPHEALAPALARSPQAGLLNLVHAVLHQAWGRVALDGGEGLGYQVELGPP